ncbi:F-box protein At1g52495-like [Spinacia oleracea]|uniref:F-box protein At1g52495-like n=1 Tax=Spinacia oleracea TaxID=3562 RepID=A0ABM3R414_SPIOL|nr:F-box protein At1g52495-like [Spinacia oleracea]
MARIRTSPILMEHGGYSKWGYAFKSFTLTSKRSLKLTAKFEIRDKVRDVTGSITLANFFHGLICLYVPSLIIVRTDEWKGEKLIIFNPTTREAVGVPLIGSYRVEHPKKCRHCVFCGIGFDSTTNDYKIILVTTDVSVNWTWLDVYVYSVRNGQWHRLHDIGPLESLEKLVRSSILAFSNAKGRILNFIARLCIKGRKEWYLLSFDVVDEVFRVIPMPEKQQQQEYYHIS